jgi:hypothetical protein
MDKDSQLLNSMLVNLLEFLTGTGEEEYLFVVVIQVLYDNFRDIGFFG